MVSNYNIKSVRVYNEGTHMQNVKLCAGGKSIDRISKSLERTTDLKTLNLTGNVINECYIDLTLEKLREVDGDKDLQEAFIKSRAKFLERGMINVIIVKLHTNSKLDELDYEYLNSLLGWSMNDIYVMPTLEFGEGVPGDMKYEIYDEFVKNMLIEKETMIRKDINIGMMVPSFYARRRIHNLFNLYKDTQHDFVTIDFANRRIDGKPSGVVPTVLKYMVAEKTTGIHPDDYKTVKKIKYDCIENTFLYGANVKPWTKTDGVSYNPALDVHSIHLSFNAIGPAHTKPRAVVLPPGWDSMGKVFQGEDYSYHKMSDDDAKNDYIEWMNENYEIEISPVFEDNVSKPSYTYVKRMNFQRANQSLETLSKAINDGDGDLLKNLISRMPDGIKDNI